MSAKLLQQYTKDLRAAVKDASIEAACNCQPARNGDGYPLFVWLRAVRRYTSASPIEELMSRNRARIDCSRVGAAREVADRINRRSPMTRAQLRLLVERIAMRYGSTTGRASYDIEAGEFDALEDSPGRRRIGFAILKLGGIDLRTPLAAVTSPRVTDLILLGYLYAETHQAFRSRLLPLGY